MAGRHSASLLIALLLFYTCGARAEVKVHTEVKVEVYLGKTAQINCTFESDDGVGGTSLEWFYVNQERQRIYFHDSIVTTIDKGTPYTDRISVYKTGANEVVLTIRDVQLQDEREYICSISSLTDGNGEGSTNLKVFDPPDPPTIKGVRGGISVNDPELSQIGSCEVKNGYPKPNITWYRNNIPLRVVSGEVDMDFSTTRESSGLYSVTSQLKKKVEKDDKDALFYCEVTYFVPGETRMTETSRINVTVYYPNTAVNIWVESPKGKIKEGDSIELHCSGNGNMPSSIFSIKHTKDDITWDTPVVVLKDVSRQHSGEYECTSMDTDNFEEITNRTAVFVNYLDDAVISPKDTILLAQGDMLEATCNALSSLQTHTTWLKDGNEVSTGHSLITKDVTFDHAGIYTCVVSAPEIEGMETSSNLQVHVMGSPEIERKDIAATEIETVIGDTADLECKARGYPAPTITWRTPDGKEIDATPVKTEYGTESKISIEIQDDLELNCTAVNAHGTDVVTFNIKAKSMIYTTTPATTTTTTTITTTTTTTTTITTISNATVQARTPKTADPPKKAGNGVIIAVIIICILLLAILGSVLYFLYKKGKICGRSGKQDFNKQKSGKDNIVVEMKSDKTEEAILLGVNGEKQSPGDQ